MSSKMTFLPHPTFWDTKDECVVCGQRTCTTEAGPKLMLECDCCQGVYCHLECHEKRLGTSLDAAKVLSPEFQWHCSDNCASIASELVALTGQKKPLRKGAGGCTVELTRHSSTLRGSAAAVDSALQILHSAFKSAPLDDGRDLVTMVCKSYTNQRSKVNNTSEEDYDFSNFRIFLMRKGPTVVSVATVRVCGEKFCEAPFIATREGYRRAGSCKVLIQELVAMLRNLKVQYLVLPAVPSVCAMWQDKFGFEPLGPVDSDILEERVIMPEGATLLCKPCAAKSTRGGKGSSMTAIVAAPKKPAPARGRKRAARFTKRLGRTASRGALRPSYREISDSDDDEEESCERGAKRRRRDSKSYSAKDDSDDEAFDPGRHGDNQSGSQSSSESDTEVALEEEAPHDSAVPTVGRVGEDRCRKEEEEAGREPSKEHGTVSAGGGPDLAQKQPEPAPVQGVSQPPSQRPVALTSNPVIESAVRTCLTCGCTQARSWVEFKPSDATGDPSVPVRWECGVCARYRSMHNGEQRPERLWKRTAARPPRPPAARPQSTAAHSIRRQQHPASELAGKATEKSRDREEKRKRRREKRQAWKKAGLPPMRILLELRHMWQCAAEREAREKLQRQELALQLGQRLADLVREAVQEEVQAEGTDKCQSIHTEACSPGKDNGLVLANENASSDGLGEVAQDNASTKLRDLFSMLA